MKKFRYHRLKRVRELQKQLAEVEVWKSYRHMMDLASETKNEVIRLSSLGDRVLSSPALLQMFSDWNEVRRKELREVYEAWVLALQELLRRRTELKKIEKLEEIWKQELLEEMMRQLSAQLDETGSARYKIKRERR